MTLWAKLLNIFSVTKKGADGVPAQIDPANISNEQKEKDMEQIQNIVNKQDATFKTIMSAQKDRKPDSSATTGLEVDNPFRDD